MSAGIGTPVERIENRILLIRGHKVLQDADLAAKLHILERKAEALALKHDSFAAHTRLQLRQVFEAIRELMRAPEPRRRPIGLVTPVDGKKS